MTAVSKTADKIKQIDVSALTDSLQADLKAVHRVLDHINEIDYARIGTNVTDLTAQLRATSEQLRTFIGQPAATHPPSTLPELSAKTDQVLAEVKAAVAKLDSVLANVNASSFNQILQNMQRASLELDEAVHKFKQYPSGVLFGQPPPPAVSVETPKGH
jgi:ABC-type transporter Mla subunit MlaD